MSLRLKFLGLLVVIPSLCLMLFLYFAISTFVADKTTYLFESQFQLLNSATLFLAEETGSLAGFEKKVRSLFLQDGFESLLVLDDSGNIRLSARPEFLGHSISDALGDSVLARLSEQAASEGSLEVTDRGGEARLVSFHRLEVENRPLVLVLHAARAGAMRASMIFLLKSLSAFTALVSLAAIISLIFSNRLTRGIRHLSEAMSAFGAGEFSASIPALSETDEVGQMARTFEEMRRKIQSLMHEQQEKAKIETEMKLAGDLQRRFFPAAHFRIENTELAGYFEPANEAGGDWWFYFLKGRKLIFLIGDVTGHGLNSAMVTGVCRSAFSLIEESFKSVQESMRLLNRAIYDTAHGELNMTCIICSLDLDTGEVSFANASHECPYIIPATTGTLKRDDFRLLDGAPGRRLGEARDSQYTEYRDRLREGEMLLLYSDGLTELCNPDEQTLGERRLLKAVGDRHESRLSAQDVLEKIWIQAKKFRRSHDLKDDISFLVLKWKRL